MNGESGDSKRMTDHEFVDELVKHISEPCGTKHGNLRYFYIREGQRALDTYSVKDATARQTLETAIKLAKAIMDIENSL